MQIIINITKFTLEYVFFFINRRMKKNLDTTIITILKVFHNTTMSTGCYVVPLSTSCLTYILPFFICIE